LIIGYVAYRHGRKVVLKSHTWIGITLMLYPCVISDTWLLYVVGAGLCLGLYVYRK
jgi:hypothetical protein